MNRTLIFMSIFCGLLAVSSTGCIRYYEWSNDLHVKKLASRSYHDRYSFDPEFKHARHFERGWKAGFTDVALGGDGNPPTFPPVPYRSFKYRNPEGHQVIDIWFDAYREGANAAISEGIQHFNYLPTSQHEHYREVVTSSTSMVSPHEPTPTEVIPSKGQSADPFEGSEPPAELNEPAEDESLSVPQVFMELREMPDSIGGQRLVSGEESSEDEVIHIRLDTLN
ncbi:MAG: hypothetical protein KDA65_04360 [Planctomycetaceae bacterium]|nr:hypothetical protein [Planctomycetaceae bacterium]